MSNHQGALHVIFSQLESILSIMEQLIDRSETLKKLPHFLAQQASRIIQELSLPHKSENNVRLEEQKLSHVPKISKDSLSPKEVEQQTIEPKAITIKPSASNFKQLSTVSKRSSNSQSRAKKSLSLTERLSLKRSNNNQSKFQTIKDSAQEEDPEIIKLRERTQIRLRYEFQYQKINLSREKSFKEKSLILSQLIEDPNAGITHDYDGEQLKSSIGDDRIKHYNMRAEFGAHAKKMKEGVDTPQNISIEVPRLHREKEHTNRTCKQMEMPLFPPPHNNLVHLHEVKNYKLEDYRKHFGRKYSRLDQYSQTLDLSTRGKEEQKDEIFSEKKHLRDSSLFQGSRQSLVEAKPLRRLALPRLHGKYKVLDRYSQL